MSSKTKTRLPKNHALRSMKLDNIYRFVSGKFNAGIERISQRLGKIRKQKWRDFEDFSSKSYIKELQHLILNL